MAGNGAGGRWITGTGRQPGGRKDMGWGGGGMHIGVGGGRRIGVGSDKNPGPRRQIIKGQGLGYIYLGYITISYRS